MRYSALRSLWGLTALLGVCALATPIRAQITPIGPFAGTASETWESFPNYFGGELVSPDGIMGGAASISTIAAGFDGMVVYEPAAGASFGLGTSGPATVSDGEKGMGINTSSSLTTIVFDGTATDFGAFWGAATGSGFPDPVTVTVSFFDVFAVLIGTETFDYSHSASADGGLDWHGYNSTTPIKTITYEAPFVVIDGLQANVDGAGPVPEPGAFALLAGFGTVGVVFLRRRK